MPHPALRFARVTLPEIGEGLGEGSASIRHSRSYPCPVSGRVAAKPPGGDPFATRNSRSPPSPRPPFRLPMPTAHFGSGEARDARFLLEWRRDLDEAIGIEAVEARSEAERIGADMPDLDPVAGIDRLGQEEGPGEDVDRIACRAADAEWHDPVGRAGAPITRRI